MYTKEQYEEKRNARYNRLLAIAEKAAAEAESAQKTARAMATKIEIIEVLDPAPDAMVRSFYCAICDKQHLRIGQIARVWVFYQEGYASQASMECLKEYSQ